MCPLVPEGRKVIGTRASRRGEPRDGRTDRVIAEKHGGIRCQQFHPASTDTRSLVVYTQMRILFFRAEAKMANTRARPPISRCASRARGRYVS